MKLGIGLGMSGLVAAAWGADLTITSFTSDGNLAWTNSVSNATYRVEWASTAQGPWQRFDALTNLSSVTATSRLVTVHVPMLYRVVWIDAPQHAGTYRYSGYEDAGGLVITGRITLSAQTNPVTGEWSLRQVGEPIGPIGPQIGEGVLRGSLSGSQLAADLNPGWADNNVFLNGQLTGNTWTGLWSYSTFGGAVNGGPFTAEKVVEGGSR